MWHRLGLLCPWLIVGSFAFALAMGSEIARPSAAEALSESYCGRIVPSGGVCGSNMGYQYWRYNRASYTGGGSIYQICGLLRTEEGRLRSDPRPLPLSGDLRLYLQPERLAGDVRIRHSIRADRCLPHHLRECR